MRGRENGGSIVRAREKDDDSLRGRENVRGNRFFFPPLILLTRLGLLDTSWAASLGFFLKNKIKESG